VSIVGRLAPPVLATAPKFDGNEPRVYEIETVALHPLHHALPKPIEIGCAPAEGAKLILGRTEPQRRRRCRRQHFVTKHFSWQLGDPFSRSRKRLINIGNY